MRIGAGGANIQRDIHSLADGQAVSFRFEDGQVALSVKGKPDATLSKGVEYYFYLSLSPGELDALYRFSMTQRGSS